MLAYPYMETIRQMRNLLVGTELDKLMVKDDLSHVPGKSKRQPRRYEAMLPMFVNVRLPAFEFDGKSYDAMNVRVRANPLAASVVQVEVTASFMNYFVAMMAKTKIDPSDSLRKRCSHSERVKSKTGLDGVQMCGKNRIAATYKNDDGQLKIRTNRISPHDDLVEASKALKASAEMTAVGEDVALAGDVGDADAVSEGIGVDEDMPDDGVVDGGGEHDDAPVESNAVSNDDDCDNEPISESSAARSSDWSAIFFFPSMSKYTVQS